MDFVAPTLLEHYIGGTYYGGAGTQDDPVDLISSDDEEALEEQAQPGRRCNSAGLPSTYL
jgi:hypothetical protein